MSTAKVIYDFLNHFKKKIPIVIDPIFESTNKRKFCDSEEYQKIHKIFSKLKPIYTPNLYEAKALIGSRNKKMNIEKIYQLLKKKYNCEFVITGGDSVSDYCLDYLEVDGKIQVLKSKKKKYQLYSWFWLYIFISAYNFFSKGLLFNRVTKKI